MLSEILIPFSLKKIRPNISSDNVKILDVGCGNHSPKITKRWFPKALYHGIDEKHYNVDSADLEACDRLFLTDLDQSGLNEVTENGYDVIIFKHVIEHLKNGDKILVELMEKLNPGGIVYVEFPSTRSLSLPSARGTLNFFDDETHIRHYSLSEIANILLQKEMRILDAGTVRDWRKIILLWAYIPLQIMSLIRYQKISARGLWDPLGFAEFILARKLE